MKGFLLAALLLFTLYGYADAAILVMSTNGTYTTKTTLEVARTAADVAGKTVVVTTPLTEAQSNITAAWPADRALKVEKGGSIGNTTAFTITGPFAPGNYQVFAGSGVVTGLEEVRPEWFGVLPSSATDDSAKMAKAVAAVAPYGELKFSAGAYSGYLSIRRNNITVSGAGSGATSITTPAGADTNVLEVGETLWTGWPVALDSVVIRGITLNGNKANVPVPTGDVTGWGLPVTNTTNVVLDDIVVKNCWMGGFGIFINSNYGRGTKLYAENCGEGHDGVAEPGFDINSSSNGIWEVTAKNCKNGIRDIANSHNNVIYGVVIDSIDNGFICGGSESVNHASNNRYNITVRGGCQYTGVTIGEAITNSTIAANIENVTGTGFLAVKATTEGNRSVGNTYNISTKNTGGNGAILGSYDSVLNHVSTTDGIGGAQGAFFATAITGDRNTINMKVIDSATWQVRTLDVQAGATRNNIASLSRSDGTFALINDAGTGTIKGYLGSLYKEGVWTPVPTGLAVIGTPTYSGTYTRSGNKVSCKFFVTSTISTASTYMTTWFVGLPYSVDSQGAVYSNDLAGSYATGQGLVEPGKINTPSWAASPAVVVTFEYTTTDAI